MGQPMLCECLHICVLRSAHECKITCFLFVCYLQTVKKNSSGFCLNSDRTAMSWIKKKKVLERSVDRNSHRDYTANRRSFTSCRLANQTPKHAAWLITPVCVGAILTGHRTCKGTVLITHFASVAPWCSTFCLP